MKRFSLVALCLLGGSLGAFGQMPAAPRPHSLSLSVEPVSTGGNSHDHDATSDKRAFEHPGAGHAEIRTRQVETNEESESIQVSVRNFGQTPDAVQVEWYFVAAPANHNTVDKQFIYDQGSKSVTIASGATEAFPVDSKEITAQIKRHNQVHMGKSGKFHSENSGKEKETGSTLDGWMVRVVADGRTVEARASKDQLADIVRDDAKLQSMPGR